MNMKRNLLITAFLLAANITCIQSSFAWGGWGHQHINNAAVFALPAEMRSFFYNHIDFITEEAVVPDLRKYINGDKGEGPKHFIDLENYHTDIAGMPGTLREAKAKFGDTLLQKEGSLPWQIEEMMNKLTKAFKEKNKNEILYVAADLAHYLGDATQPLHSTNNYDGQLTGQKGIHSFFESHLPQSFGDAYNFNTGDVHFIKDVDAETWAIIGHTHSLTDSVLNAEKEARKAIPADDIFVKDENGQVKKNRYGQQINSEAFASAYHKQLNGLIERQIRAAVSATASYWYTAWVNAGKPDLSDLDPAGTTKRNQKNFKADYKLWQKGKLNGFTSVSEI